MPTVDDSKTFGEQVELAFCLAAMKQGLAVSRPIGDSQKYDVITDDNGRLCRVQVKTGHWHSALVCKAACFSGGPRRRAAYTADHTDLIAVFVPGPGIWYIIPVESTGGKKTLSLRPLARQKECEFDEYKNAWHLLKYA